mgnify:CR=1 FL=1
MNYEPTEQCPECASRELELVHGFELTCKSCGLIVETIPERENLTISNDTLVFEGDGAVNHSPDSYTPRMVIMAPTERLEDDRRWTIPSPKKKESKKIQKKSQANRIAKKFQDAHSKLEKIEKLISEEEGKEEPDLSKIYELRDSKLEAEVEFEEIRKDSKNFALRGGWGEDTTPEKLEMMVVNNSARDWLRLSNTEDETSLEADSKSTLLKLNELGHRVSRWAAWWEGSIRRRGFIDELMWGSGVPMRSLHDEDGNARIAPSHERKGLEIFIGLVGDGDGFWFFDDFTKITRMNPNLINRILEDDLPIARSSRATLVRMRYRQWKDPPSISDFVARCAKNCGTETMGIESVTPSEIPIPDDDLWEKLGVGPRGTGISLAPRFWIEMHDRSPKIEQEPEKDGRSHYDGWEYSSNPESSDTTQQKGSSIHQSERFEEITESPIDVEDEVERWGYVRRHPSPIMLRHIPLAYYIAQEFWNRRVPEFRGAAVRMLDLIAKDLEWCPATVDEMDAWWDGHWKGQSDDTPSVTTLRITSE